MMPKWLTLRFASSIRSSPAWRSPSRWPLLCEVPMSKRKFKKGKQVSSLDELFEHQHFVVQYGPRSPERTVHAGFILSWQVRMAQLFISDKRIWVADRLTNGEFYDGKTDEEMKEIVGEETLCDLYCPLPDYLKGVHCYGGEPVMCEGSHCDKALEAWKEEFAE